MTASFTLKPTNTVQSCQIVLLCDHASNRVPENLPSALGLDQSEMERHIAYDIGAAGLTKSMGRNLSAPVVLSNFSRLVIDPNRGEDDPTLIMQLYDGTIIPANRQLTLDDINARLETLHRPYHEMIDALLVDYDDPIIVSIHSFTPQLRGRPLRPWHVGVLYADDTRLSDTLFAELSSEDDLVVGDNQPYTGRLTGDTMDRHAIVHGHLHVLIEIRNDLIETEEQQIYWANRLSPILLRAIAKAKGTENG